MARVVSVKFDDHKDEVLSASKEQIIAWLNAIGEDASATASNFCPVDTGRLKNSITHAVDESENCVYIGTNVDYAIWHEFGTGKYSSGGRQGGWTYKGEDGEWHYTEGVPARHFIQFGCTAHKSEYKAMLESYLKG